MRTLKLALSAVILFALATCNGGVHSPTEPPNHISCESGFSGEWSWILQSCGGFTKGSAPAQLSTANGCRLTLDTTPDNLKALGQTYTLVVAFDAKTATLERKGTVCDTVDNGTIIAQKGHEFSIQFKATPTQQCCNNDYFVNIAY